jgi:hypothetical protein
MGITHTQSSHQRQLVRLLLLSAFDITTAVNYCCAGLRVPVIFIAMSMGKIYVIILILNYNKIIIKKIKK